MANMDVAVLADELKGRDFTTFHEGVPRLEEVEKWLERRDWSADAKAIVLRMATMTIKIGTTIVAVGRKILNTVLEVAGQYPQTTFGVVIGTVLSLLVGSIPIIGAVLGALLSPILLIFGIGAGAIADFRNAHFEARMKLILAEYGALQP
jgi:hypothetical protein